MIVAGIGCRRHTSSDAIAALVREAGMQMGGTATLLAAPWFKADEPGLAGAATLLGLPLVLIDAAALARAQADCPTPSAAAYAATGFASVAEACALAAAGPGGRLVLPRIATPFATCALAESSTP